MRGNIFSPESLLSNGIGLLLFILAINRPVTTRVLLCLLFIGAACYNVIGAVIHPEWYLVYGDLTVSPLYEQFIKGAFSRHITGYVLAIAVAQLGIGIFIGGKGWQAAVGLAGAVIFLLAIAPLGAGAAFPFPILVATACMVLVVKRVDATLPEIFSDKFLKHSRPAA